jgi:hypothetical protein
MPPFFRSSKKQAGKASAMAGQRVSPGICSRAIQCIRTPDQIRAVPHLESRLLSDEDIVVQGPFFVADGVELQSLVGRYRGTWMMAVVPREAATKMPEGNLLELTAHRWALMYRGKDGRKNTLAAGEY